MNFIEDLNSIRSGAGKAKRDIKKIEAYAEQHSALHDADPDWKCGDSAMEFFNSIADDVSSTNLIEQAAYRREADAYQREAVSSLMEEFFGKVITIEADGSESDEEMRSRIRQAISEDETFQSIVSETKKGQKGGK